MSYLSYLLTLCSLYQILSPYHSFVVLSNFCHLLAPCYLFTFYVIISPYKCTYCTHHKQHNSFFCLIVRTLSALIYISNSPGVFGHRAILTMGGSRHGWGVFAKNYVIPLLASTCPLHWLLLILLHHPSKPAYFVSTPLV